jgi:SAM-dependent methyltransferase
MENDQSQFYESSDRYYQTVRKQPHDYFSEYLKFVSFYVAHHSHVLDIGCATGQSTYLLKSVNYCATGLDGSSRFISFAKKKFPRIDFVQADLRKLPFKNNYFDAVASYNTLEHVKDVDKCLFEIVRVTRPGGKILINSPNLLSIKLIINSLLYHNGMTFEGKKNPVQLFLLLIRNIALISKRKLFNKPNIIYRKPDLSFKYPDTDATWYLNPLDIKYLLIEKKCRILSYQKINHLEAKKGMLIRVLAKLFPSHMSIVRIVAIKNK